jgi:hypothetical protein
MMMAAWCGTTLVICDDQRFVGPTRKWRQARIQQQRKSNAAMASDFAATVISGDTCSM